MDDASRALANDLRTEVTRAIQPLLSLSETMALASRGDGKWTRKEILGHLIDSAANNHQRFVRAQRVDPLVWPGYEQDAWVAAHGYRDRPWQELVNLWISLNVHVAFVIDRIPADCLVTECRIGSDAPASLEWLIRDYVRHMRHHLDQILSR